MKDLIDTYKQVMSYWPSGVAIVTSEHEAQRYGMTVSSFTSVSLHPAMISVCIDKRSQMCLLLQKSKHFAINLLADTQVDLGKAFANHELSMAQRFEKAEFETHETSSPVLKSCLGWLDCRMSSFHDTGDHLIYVGEVLKGHAFGEGSPTIFYRRGWHGLS